MMDTKNDRRDFFRKVAQLTFLSAMIGGTACLLNDNRIQTSGCSDNRFCRNCRKLNNCSLDQAKKYKDDERKERT